MTRHAYLALTMLLSGACRFAGPDGKSPFVDVDVDADVDGGLPKEEPDPDDDTDEGSGPAIDARAPDRGNSDARAAPRDAAAGDAAAGDDAAGDDAAGEAAAGDATVGDGATAARDGAVPARDGATKARPDALIANCDPPPDLACDPVSGEGCLLLMQCLADPSSSTPAAYCVFGGVQLDVTCTQDSLSTDCPAQHTCVMGQCRKYCYCDADCDNGAACVDPSGAGSTRFRVCEQT